MKTPATSLPKSTNETEPEEEVDMEGKGGPETTQDKEPVCEDVPLSNDIQQEMDWFLQSKHCRSLLYPTVAREHLRKVSCFWYMPQISLGLTLSL